MQASVSDADARFLSASESLPNESVTNVVACSGRRQSTPRFPPFLDRFESIGGAPGPHVPTSPRNAPDEGSGSRGRV
eukprot:5916126-Pyramimonas_sp.AAC.1